MSSRSVFFYIVLLFVPIIALLYVLNAYNLKLKECINHCDYIGQIPYQYVEGQCICKEKK